ncbi:hypothetical protein QMY64_09930 [Phocaeicola dorei]|nr:hypothetical protein QMY64_09930 [Phocaeicola dorei]
MNYVQAVYDFHSNSADNKKNHPGKGVERSGKELGTSLFPLVGRGNVDTEED